MHISTHIMYPGNCKDAFEFYQSIFGGTLNMLSYGESPVKDQVPEDWQDKLAHASLLINGLEIAGADILPEQYQSPSGFNLLLQLEDTSNAKTFFDALSAGGKVTMPLDKTYWSPCYGILVDPFGISWEINCADE